VLFDRWIEHGDPSALLNASIFFDFRPLFGNTPLGERLRDHVIRRAGNARFLKQMADNALRNRAPSGSALLGSLLGDHATRQVDLKLNGTVPFVDAARIWAYQGGLAETNTSGRFMVLAARGRLPEGDVRGWIAAFEFFQLMRLREQHRRVDVDSTERNPNLVDLEHMSALDRRVINEAFRQARKLQQRLQLDFPG
jgi:CBS domain-containing protein